MLEAVLWFLVLEGHELLCVPEAEGQAPVVVAECEPGHDDCVMLLEQMAELKDVPCELEAAEEDS